MWLRDALPRDLPEARVLIYGYESKLDGSTSFQNLGDIVSKFRASLREIRRNVGQRRPFLFIAHSLGGLVLKQAVVQMAGSKNKDDALPLEATSDILFFGVPNQGMDITSLYPMVHGQLNMALLATLGKNNDHLENLVVKFNEVSSSRFYKIVSFYETLSSRTARMDSSGKWSMSGDHTVLVDRQSARSGRWDEALPINRTHSDMIKFDRSDDVYNIVCGHLKRNIMQASAVIGLRRMSTESLDISTDTNFKHTVAKPTVTKPDRAFGSQEQQKALQALRASGHNVKEWNFSPERALFWAVWKGNEGAVRWLLQESQEKIPDVNATDIIGQTVLHIAAHQVHAIMMELLLEDGANPHTSAFARLMTPLQIAAADGSLAIARLLLDSGANANTYLESKEDVPLSTALHFAANGGHTTIVHLLLTHGANVDARAFDTRVTALHLASLQGHEATVRILLERDASVYVTGKNHRTALHYATDTANEAIVRMLLNKGADVNAVDEHRWSPLHDAVKAESEAIAKILLENGSNPNAVALEEVTPLHYAALLGHERHVKVLLEKGANPYTRTADDQTPLDYAKAEERVAIVRLLEPITDSALNEFFDDSYGKSTLS